MIRNKIKKYILLMPKWHKLCSFWSYTPTANPIFLNSRESCTYSDLIFIIRGFETLIWVIFKGFQHFIFKFISNIQFELNYIVILLEQKKYIQTIY